MSRFTAIPVSLKALLEQVENGKIQLPDFQRGWVWDDDRIKGLLVSISRGFPVGAVMTLDAGGDIKFQSRLIEGATSNGMAQPEQYLLDGQQRLTSLYQAMRYAGPVETRDRPGGGRVRKRWYYVDIQKCLDSLVDRDDTIISVREDRVVRSNFGRDVELDLSSQDREFEQHMIPTENVIDGMGWGFKYAQYWQKRGGHPHGDPFMFFERFKVISSCSRWHCWQPIPGGLYDSIINKTPIDAVTNRKLGGRAPSVYLKRLRRDIDEDKLNRILDSHWIDREALEKDRFGDCFVSRGQAMLDLVSQTMGKSTVDGRQVFRDALDSAGLTGDSYESDDDVEYDAVGESMETAT